MTVVFTRFFFVRIRNVFFFFSLPNFKKQILCGIRYYLRQATNPTARHR
jgi:hypothetical protein